MLPQGKLRCTSCNRVFDPQLVEVSVRNDPDLFVGDAGKPVRARLDLTLRCPHCAVEQWLDDQWTASISQE